MIYLLVGSFLGAFAAKELLSWYFGGVPVDFKSFFLAARGLVEQHDIYDVKSLRALAHAEGVSGPVFPYLYSPVLAFYLSPLSYLGIGAAHTLWTLLSIMLCAVIMLKSIRLAGSSLPMDSTSPVSYTHAFWACVLFYALPFDNSLRCGQVNVLVLSLVVASVSLSFFRGRDAAAGSLLAAAALIKVTPALLLVFFLVSRRFRVVYGFVGGGLAIALPTLFVKGGWGAWMSYFRFIPSAVHGEAIPGLFHLDSLANFSIAGLFARLTADPDTVRSLSIAAIAALLILLVHQHMRSRQSALWPCLLLPYLVLMTVASPLTYIHHVIYIYPGLVVTLLHDSDDTRSALRFVRASVLAVCVIASIDFPSMYKEAGWDLAVPAWVTSLNLYALLGLFLLALVLLRLKTPTSGGPRPVSAGSGAEGPEEDRPLSRPADRLHRGRVLPP